VIAIQQLSSLIEPISPISRRTLTWNGCYDEAATVFDTPMSSELRHQRFCFLPPSGQPSIACPVAWADPADTNGAANQGAAFRIGELSIFQGSPLLFSLLVSTRLLFSLLFSLFSRLFLLDSADTACRVRYPVLNALGNYWITPLLVSLVLCPPRVCLLVRAEPLSLFFFAAVLTVISTSVPCRAPVCEISIFESGDRCMVENLSVSLTEQSAYVAVRL